MMSGSTHANGARFLVSALLWESAVVAVYLFNGAMDVAEDRTNRSRRPVARGAIAPETAARCAGLFAVLALAGAVVSRPPLTVAVLVLLLLGFLYSGPPLYLKRYSIATVLIAGSGGLLTYYAGYTVTGGSSGRGEAAVFALSMTLWMVVVGAGAKDLPDVAGDLAAGRRTRVVVHGEKRVLTEVACVALAIGAAFLVAVLYLAPALAWPAAVTLVGAVCVAAISLGRISRGGQKSSRLPYQAFMATQYATHLVLLGSVSFAPVFRALHLSWW